MPVYYFDVMKGDVVSIPGEGVEFPNDEIARGYALGIVSTFQSGISDRVSIRTEAGEPVADVRADEPVERSKSTSDLPDGNEPKR